MKNPYEDEGSTIECFAVNGKFYEHVIFPADDRVELLSFNGTVLLTYTSDCKVMQEGERIGSFRMGRDYTWTYHSKGNGKSMSFGKDLLAAEIEFSKSWLEDSEQKP